MDSNGAPVLTRSQSLTGDRVSMSGLSPVHSSPPSVNPPPAYIAASAASGIITGEQQALSPGLNNDQNAESISDVVLVSAASLALINAFLDQLLYNFLSTARSTSLTSLRPAVAEVLKPRLARDAIAGADDELKEFLGGGDDEELAAFHGGQEHRGDWDLDLVWKLTRLRCMVYTRLGDMEEDDEDDYIEKEQLDGSGGGPRRFSSHLGTVSPAAAIFLTSIMEFVGEQTLLIAAEAARARLLSKPGSRDPSASQFSPGATPERMSVEEGDTEKIALDRTYGRLWRTWRRRIRSPSHSMSRPISRDSFYRRGHSSTFGGSRTSSISTIEDSYDREDMRIRLNVAEVLHEDDPTSVPLPMTENDVNEIEVPGVAQHEDELDDRSKTPTAMAKLRPQSMLVFPSGVNPSTPTSPMSPDEEIIQNDEPVGRVRSRSLPTPRQTPYASPSDEHPGESTFVTPMENANPMDELEVPEPNEDQLRTPTAESHTLEMQNRDEEIDNKPGVMAGIAVGAASLGAATVADPSAAHIFSHSKPEAVDESQTPRETPTISTQHVEEIVENKEVDGVVDEESNARTPMASTMNVPHITQHLVGELSAGNNQSKRASRASEIYVYVKQPHHGRDPSLTTTEAGDDYDYRNDPLDHEVGMQGGADPEDLALSDNEDQVASKEEPKVFVLSSPPAGKNRSSEYPVKREDMTGTVMASTESPTVFRTPGAENGVPPLTPLRELMEAAHDTSDEASRSSMAASQKHDSLNPKHDSLNQKHDSLGQRHDSLMYQEMAPSGQSARSDTQSSNSQNKHSSAGSRYSEHRNQAVLFPQQQQHQTVPSFSSISNTAGDRASVQRITPPPLTPREAGATRTQRSESLGSIDPKRPHTANSATSRVSRKQPVPVGTSIDGATGTNGDNQRDTVGPDSFDNLVKSGQTIQYTLTPQSMREMESPGSPRWSNKPRTQTSELADFLKNTGPPDEERPKTARSVASTKGMNGLRSHPPEPPQRSPTQPAITLKHKSTDLVEATQKPKRKILGMQEARDPRVEKSSTRDFADFIRSTGPERAQQLPTTISSRPSSRPATAAADSAPPPSFATHLPGAKSAENSPKISRSHTVAASTRTSSGEPKRSGSKLEARPAALPQGNKSSDLIDFIREGPPHELRDGNNRIPRTIAPFRTTMDSDEISALGVGASVDKDALARVSVASTQESSVPTVSVHSSSNSRTGLLDSSNYPGARSNKSASTARSPTQNDDIRPKRKQRRVRDPYAIDSDSEEEVRYTAPAKPKREEESLIDFLRNVAPPSESQTTPQLLNTSAAASATQKGSAPNIKDRIMRKSSVTTGPSKVRQRSEPLNLPTRRSSSGVLQNSPGVAGTTGVPKSTAPPPRSVSPHLSQTGSRLDSYKPTQPTYAAHIDRVRGNKSVAQGQARHSPSETTITNRPTNTSDLADFFRNTGPPTTNQTYAPSVTKEETGFSRMFSRKKKNAAMA